MDNQEIALHFTDSERLNSQSLSKWFRGVGVALLIIGVLAVLLPYIATIAVEMLAAVILLVAGILQLAHAIQVRKWRRVTWEVLVSLLFIAGGLLFLAYPFSGIMALTVLLGVFFLVHGAFKTPLAFNWKPRPGWGWILLSGVLSLILGILLIAGLPGTAAWAIGLLLGIDLIFTGVTMLILGGKVRTLATQ